MKEQKSPLTTPSPPTHKEVVKGEKQRFYHVCMRVSRATHPAVGHSCVSVSLPVPSRYPMYLIYVQNYNVQTLCFFETVPLPPKKYHKGKGVEKAKNIYIYKSPPPPIYNVQAPNTQKPTPVAPSVVRLFTQSQLLKSPGGRSRSHHGGRGAG